MGQSCLVDADLSHSSSRIRLFNASVMPTIPRGKMQYTMVERAAKFISDALKRNHGLCT